MTTTTDDREFQMIPLESLIPSEDNPRGNEKDPDLVEMAATMKEVGVRQALSVRPHPFEDGSYEVMAGHRRLKAAQMACLGAVPCVIEDADEQLRQATFTIENWHRKPLTPMQQARALQQVAESGVSQRELGKAVGISQGHVSKLLGLLKLPEKAQGWVDRGDITQDAAVQLAALPKPVIEKLTSGNRVPTPMDVINAKAAGERSKAIDKSKKKVADEGWAVVDDYDQFIYDGKDNPILVGGGYGSLTHVDPDEHVSAPCHAVHIDHGGRIIPVCTNPSAHPAPEPEPGESTDKKVHVRDVTPESAGDKAVAALMAAMEPSYHRAIEKAKVFSETTAVFGLAAWLRCNDIWEAAANARELLKIEADVEALEDLANFMEEYEEVTGELLCALGIGTTMDSLIEVVRAAADGTPVEIFLDSGHHATDARKLVDYLREVLPDDEIGTLEDIVGDFAAVEDEDAEDAEVVQSEDAGEQDDELVVEVAGVEDAEIVQSDELATVNVFQKGKRYFQSCSKCGPLDGFNTTEDMAQDRASFHIEEKHAEQLAKAAS